MPIVSAFFGVLIRMYYQDHDPPYIHAERAGDHATFTFDAVLLAGSLRSRRAQRDIAAWASLHRRELEANWAALRQGQSLERIEPLQ
jgi:hypothetical protein